MKKIKITKELMEVIKAKSDLGEGIQVGHNTITGEDEIVFPKVFFDFNGKSFAVEYRWFGVDETKDRWRWEYSVKEGDFIDLIPF